MPGIPVYIHPEAGGGAAPHRAADLGGNDWAKRTRSGVIFQRSAGADDTPSRVGMLAVCRGTGCLLVFFAET